MDSCGVTYQVARNCAITRTAGGRNQPVPRRAVGPNGFKSFFRSGGFAVGKGVNGFVGWNNIDVQNRCCYNDGCSGAFICSFIGGRLWDSCLVDYDIGANCVLARRAGAVKQPVPTGVQNVKSFPVFSNIPFFPQNGPLNTFNGLPFNFGPFF